MAEDNKPWIDHIAGHAVTAMKDLVDYATDIITLRENWRNNWERSADDGTMDYIPGCFDIIRFLIDAVSFIHNWEWEGELENQDESFAAFRAEHPLNVIYWNPDGVTVPMFDRCMYLIHLLGYPTDEIYEIWDEFEATKDNPEDAGDRIKRYRDQGK